MLPERRLYCQSLLAAAIERWASPRSQSVHLPMLPEPTAPADAVFNVREYGALGNGLVDDLPAIQKAVHAAEARFDATPVLVRNRISQTPLVYFPPGTYRVTGSIVVTRQLMLRGEGMTTSIVASVADAPVFLLRMGTLRLYTAPALRDLGITGTYAGRPHPHTRQTGVLLLHDPASSDATAILERCAIVGCAGHGFYSETRGNTNRLYRCLIQTNQLDGIHLGGAYNTNCRILDNIIRENRRGLVFEPDPGARLFSGLVAHNLFESNHEAGTGRIGGDGRPGQAIAMRRCRSIQIVENYFERHLNHIYAVESCRFITIRGNVFYGASRLPGLYPGFGGPARRACDIYLEGEGNCEFTLADNVFESPVRPDDTSPLDWGTDAWGDSYEQLHLTGNDHRLLDNARSTTSYCGGGTLSRRTNAYSEDFGRDLNAPGGYRTPLHGWAAQAMHRGSPPAPLPRSGGAVHALRDGSITGVAVKLGAGLASGTIRVVVHLDGSPTAAAVEVSAGRDFAAVTWDKDALPVAPGASITVHASSTLDQDPTPIAVDAVVELES
jgi:hypothetical protein